MTLSRPLAVLSVLAAGIAAACRESTDPAPAALTGTFAAQAIADDSLPVPVACGLGSCRYLTALQLRFRTRGRLIDVRRFSDVTNAGDTTFSTDYGDAFAYRLFGRDSIELIRPYADTAYADSGAVRGDTILLNLRKLDQRFGGIGSGRGVVVRYVRIVTPAP